MEETAIEKTANAEDAGVSAETDRRIQGKERKRETPL